MNVDQGSLPMTCYLGVPANLGENLKPKIFALSWVRMPYLSESRQTGQSGPLSFQKTTLCLKAPLDVLPKKTLSGLEPFVVSFQMVRKELGWKVYNLSPDFLLGYENWAKQTPVRSKLYKF